MTQALEIHQDGELTAEKKDTKEKEKGLGGKSSHYNQSKMTEQCAFPAHFPENRRGIPGE